MEFNVGNAKNAAQEIAAANFPTIRHYHVAYSFSPVPQTTAGSPGGWQECSPQTVSGFTAVGYFFARHLQQALNVPVGLIHTSWGGTPAEAWTSGEALKTMPDFKPAVEEMEKHLADDPSIEKDYKEKSAEWQKSFDAVLAAPLEEWQLSAFDDAAWKEMKLPTLWENAGLPDVDGIVWFRKTVELPDAWAGKEASLSLGAIDDNDITWVNGVKVGETAGYNKPRVYKVPADAVKAGKLNIAVRVVDTGGGGGLWGKPEEMKLESAGQEPISLAGNWRYSMNDGTAKLSKRPAPPPGMKNQNTPTALVNAMLNPLIPYTMRGAIWYQGESNAWRAYQYRTLFPTMIKDWRSRWQEGDFPFLFVQLANFMAAPKEPGPSAWAELREAQNMTLSLPNTGRAVIIDIGEGADIHPKNKQDVGKRLALSAEATVYGQKIEYDGPRYKSMKVEGAAIRLNFDHVGAGLVAKGGEPLKQFAIAGADQKFVWADAKIDGETVVVSSDKVPAPAAVRYAWADNPEGCNLYNKDELPASPFRTDDWPISTGGPK